MQSDTALPRCPLTSRGNRHPGADNSNPICCPTPSPAPQQLQPRQQGACFPSGSHKSHLSSCASGSLPGTAWEQHPNFLLVTPFPVRHVCSLPAQGILISPGSNLTREKGQCLGICLHVPERRNLLLTPSYSIHSHSTASPRIPLVVEQQVLLQSPGCLGNTLLTQEHTLEPGEGREVWKTILLGNQSPAPCPLPPPPHPASPAAHRGKRAQRDEEGKGSWYREMRNAFGCCTWGCGCSLFPGSQSLGGA